MPEGLRQRYMSVGEATASNLTFLLKEYADHSASAGMRRKFHWPPPPPLRTVGLYQFVRTRFMYVVHPADANVWKLLSPEPSAPRVTSEAAPKSPSGQLSNRGRMEQEAAFEAHSSCATRCGDVLLRALVTLVLSAAFVACVRRVPSRLARS